MGMRVIVVLLWGFVTWRWLGHGLGRWLGVGWAWVGALVEALVEALVGALVGQYLFGCNMKVSKIFKISGRDLSGQAQSTAMEPVYVIGKAYDVLVCYHYDSIGILLS